HQAAGVCLFFGLKAPGTIDLATSRMEEIHPKPVFILLMVPHCGMEVFYVTGFTVMLGQGMVTPILPLYGRSFGVSAAVVGLLITSFGLAQVLTDLPAGYLSERYGAAKLLLVGPAITAVASLMAGLASSFWLLVFWRFWQGVGSAVFTTAAMARVAEFSPPGSTSRNMV
ncbi:MAG: MFS transporter, partial [Moorella sp. (in: Bacteria)]|nr:MFS transporter [Moorella sp. (in: firmicutes)]